MEPGEGQEPSVVPLSDEQEAGVRRVAAFGRVDPLPLLESLNAECAAEARRAEARASGSMGAARLDKLNGPPILKLPQTTAPAPATTTPDYSATER